MDSRHVHWENCNPSGTKERYLKEDLETLETMKKLDVASWELPWEDISHPFFEKDTLIFTVFYLNPTCNEEERSSELDSVFNRLKQLLGPYINYYPWYDSPVKLELVSHNEYQYLYGELVYGDSLLDEWMVTNILFQFSHDQPDLYIHVFDSDGEFLLIEAAETLPEWLDPSNGSNRDWFNNGRLILIPEQYYPERPLKLIEALTFIEKAAYKLGVDYEINQKLAKMLNKFPVEALKSLRPCELSLDPKVGYFLLENPHRLSKSIDLYIKEKLPKTKPLKHIPKSANLEKFDLCFNSLSHTILNMYITHELNSTFEEVAGTAIAVGLDELLTYDKDVLHEFDQFNSNEKQKTNIFDELQQSLLERGEIKTVIEATSGSEELPEKQEDDEELIMGKLSAFFKDTEAGLGGIDNRNIERDPNDPDYNTDDEDEDAVKKGSLKVEEVDEGDEEDSDDGVALQEKLDNEAKKYFESENVSITEDDFFEFFLANALKLAPEEIASYLKTNKPNDNSKDYNDDSDYESEVEDLDNDTANNELEAIQNLLKSMKTDGGIVGPAATLLQQLGLDGGIDDET